jgi:transposase
MIKLTFTQEEIDALHYERLHHPHPRVRLKMEVLLLKSQGLSHSAITKHARISANTLRNYLREYAEGGIEALRTQRFHRPQSALMRHREILETEFRAHRPVSIQEAISRIQQLTGVLRRTTQVRQFLKTLGFHQLSRGSIGSSRVESLRQPKVSGQCSGVEAAPAERSGQMNL